MYRMVHSGTRNKMLWCLLFHSEYSGHSVAIGRLIGLANGTHVKVPPFMCLLRILLLLYSMVRSGYLEEC